MANSSGWKLRIFRPGLARAADIGPRSSFPSASQSSRLSSSRKTGSRSSPTEWISGTISGWRKRQRFESVRNPAERSRLRVPALSA
jgi:hypothetical protein